MCLLVWGGWNVATTVGMVLHLSNESFLRPGQSLYALSILRSGLGRLADRCVSFLFSVFLFLMYFVDGKESLKRSLTYLPLL